MMLYWFKLYIMSKLSNSVLETIKTPTTKKAVKKTPIKKVVKKSESVILKTSVNTNWKLQTRSLSALVRYAKNEGKQDLQKLIDATNKTKKTNVTIGQIANIKNIVAMASERELYKNASEDKTKFVKGDKKELFSFWLVILTVGRMAKK